MRLTKFEFCNAVDMFEEMCRQESEIQEMLGISDPEWVPGKWIGAFYELLTDASEVEEDPNYGTDLDWFCFDTNFGKKEDYCKVYDKDTGITWTIKTPDILYDYITRDEQNLWEAAV